MSCRVTFHGTKNAYDFKKGKMEQTWARAKVRIARRTKLVPPAKSVTLSNLNPAAMTKKDNCIATVTMAQIAKLSTSGGIT